jgi:hypothetical protein
MVFGILCQRLLFLRRNTLLSISRPLRAAGAGGAGKNTVDLPVDEPIDIMTVGVFFVDEQRRKF